MQPPGERRRMDFREYNVSLTIKRRFEAVKVRQAQWQMRVTLRGNCGYASGDSDSGEHEEKTIMWVESEIKEEHVLAVMSLKKCNACCIQAATCICPLLLHKGNDNLSAPVPLLSKVCLIVPVVVICTSCFYFSFAIATHNTDSE